MKLGDQVVAATTRRRSQPLYASVVSVYAPTHRASQEDKDKFFDDLQGVVDGISADDLSLIVGDFNAWVGCGERGDSWAGVRGCHGVGRVNDNGEALSSWCAQNGLAVMHTMFQKRIHQYTWQHPGSKQWHCIDYVLMRQNQRSYCCDVSVLRSADCWIDHKLLCAQLKIGITKKRVKAVTRKRFAVSGLRDSKVHERFVEKVCDIVEESWDEMASGVEMWEVIRDSMVNATEITLGWGNRNQPDWFKEKGSLLKELIDRRNLLFQRWLRSGQNSDRQRYVLQRREVTKTVKKAKNDWLQEKASVWKRRCCLGVLKGACGRV